MNEGGIPDDFRAGILFACTLLAEPGFDF